MEDNKLKRSFDLSNLPPEIMDEVLDFAEFLIAKNGLQAKPPEPQLEINIDVERARKGISQAIRKRLQADQKITEEERKSRPFSFSWAGGLKEYKEEFTSLELQKKASEWW